MSKLAEILNNLNCGSNRFLSKILSLYLKYLPLRINGYWLYLNPQDTGFAYQLLFNEYETYSNSVIKKLLKRGSIVCDIGAHIGDHSMFLSRLVGNRGKVYAFEPEENNFRNLTKNLQINGVNNVIPKQMAISDKKKLVNLYVSDKVTTDHRIVKPCKENRDTIAIEANSLDQLLKREKKIDFVKIDVQGVEIQCLVGMRQIVQRNDKIDLIVECWPEGLKEAGYNTIKLLKTIRSLGLIIYYIDEDNKTLEKIMDDLKFIKLLTNKEFVNLLCKKE